MNHSPADIVYYLLIQEGILVNGWTATTNSLKADTAPRIGLFDTSPEILNAQLRDGLADSRYGIALSVHNLSQNLAWTKIKTLTDYLQGVFNTTITIGSSTYSIGSIHLKSGPLNNGKEPPEFKRHKFTSNFVAIIGV